MVNVMLLMFATCHPLHSLHHHNWNSLC